MPAKKTAAAKNQSSQAEHDFYGDGEESAPSGAKLVLRDGEKSQDFVLRAARDRNVKFIRLWFTDILDILKSVAITAAELENALLEGISFDGSAIEGFARGGETDPRHVLKKQVQATADLGYTYYVGPEVEFFYF